MLKVLSTLETLSTDIGLLFSSNSILPVNPVEGFGSNTLLSNLTINSFLEIASKLVAFAGVFVTWTENGTSIGGTILCSTVWSTITVDLSNGFVW